MINYNFIMLDRFCDDVRHMDIYYPYNSDGTKIKQAYWKVVDTDLITIELKFESGKTISRTCSDPILLIISKCVYNEDEV